MPRPDEYPGRAPSDPLALSEARYRRLFEVLDEGVVVIGPDDRVETANPAAAKLFAEAGINLVGAEVHELAKGSFVYADGTPMDPPEIASDIVRSSGSALGPIVFGIARPGIPTIWVSSTSMPLETDEQGKVLRILVSAADVTPLREALARAADSEARLGDVLNRTHDGIVVIGRDGYFTYANLAACEILAHDPERISRLRITDLVLPVHHAALAGDMAALAGGASLVSEYSVLRGDGTSAWIEVSQSSAGDGTVQAVIRDVTGRRTLEAERRRLVQAVNEAGDAILMTGSGRRITYANQAFTRLVGRSASDVVGAAVTEYLAHLPKGLRIDDLQNMLLDAGRWVGDVSLKRADGTEIPAALRITLLREADGEPTGLLILARDVRVERETLARLAQSARMEGIGQLAGGVAHDFNNLLTSILGHVEFAAETIAPDNPAVADLEEIKNAAVGAQALTRQLLAVGRRSVLRPRVVDLREFLANAEWVLRPLVGDDVEVIVEPGDRLPRVHVDPGMLERAVINLAVNARETMTAGGTITLAADHEPAPSGPGNVILRVSDTGTGMPQEVADHLFEPFFTARPVGESAGLGLTMVHGFVEQSGGSIEVRSDPANGTTFLLSFPGMAVLTPEPVGAPVRVVPPRRGNGTILVVEDVGVLRAIAERILSAEGYDVLSAPDGPSAIAIADRFPDRIDVLFTDLAMPGMGGTELAIALRASRPEIRVLCTSGYSDEEALRRGTGREWDAFLPKPYTRDTVLQGIREQLHAAPGRG